MFGLTQPCQGQIRRSSQATDFAEIPVGSNLYDTSDWGRHGTRTIANCAIDNTYSSYSGKKIDFLSSFIGGVLPELLWKKIGTGTVTDILCLFVLNSTLTGNLQTTFCLLARNDDTTAGSGYRSGAETSNTSARVHRVENNYDTNFFNDTNWSYSSGTKYWLRLNVNGTTAKSKHWTYGSAEPSTWDVTQNGGGTTWASGYTGFVNGHNGAETYILWFSVGFNGADAPYPVG